MTQEELDALPDVTPGLVYEERVIDGMKVRVPRQQGGVGALFIGPEDGLVRDSAGRRWMVGQHNGVRVKRLSNSWT